MTLWQSFFLGVMAAYTPCVIALAVMLYFAAEEE